MMRSVRMAEKEHPERYSWWLNELDSLGISTLEKDKDGLKKHFMKIIFKPIVKVIDSETGSDKYT